MVKLKTKLIDLLKEDSRLWDKGKKELNETLLKDLIDKLDEKLLEMLLSEKDFKEKFFVKVRNAFVLKQNEIKFFIDENKLDNSYTEYQNKIGLRVSGKLLSERDEVVLDWPFKDCVLEGGMTREEEKRNEIFFNEVLAKDEIDRLEDPKALINWKRYTTKGEEKIKELKRDQDGIIRENLIIKGNNLLALHCLKERFAGKVKLIYIDPPYNRDAETFYNDNFQRSTWLTFMRNRLMIAKELLSADGMIYISIDDKQQSYLKVLCDSDDVFGESNFVATICIKTSSINGLRTKNNKPTKVKDYLLLYAKDLSNFKYCQQYEEDYNIDHYSLYLNKNGSNNPKRWKVENVDDILCKQYKTNDISTIPDRYIKKFYFDNREKLYSSQPVADRLDRVAFSLKNPNQVSVYVNPDKTETYMYKKRILDPFADKFRVVDKESKPMKLIGDLWTDISYTGIDKEGSVKMVGGKKPEKLIKRIYETGTKKGDIVLDFHLGSGTSCAVAHKMGLQYIGVEQLNYDENDSIARLQNVIKGDQSGISKSVDWQGGGDFICLELAKWNEKAKEKIIKANNLNELCKLFDELYEEYFLNYNVKTKEFKEKTIKEENFKKLGLDKQKKLFVEMLDMNQMYVNFSERSDKKYGFSEEDIALSEEFYKEL